MGAQSEYRAQLVNGEINVGIVVENVCHPLQAEGHMAGQVGGEKSPGTDTVLSLCPKR